MLTPTTVLKDNSNTTTNYKWKYSKTKFTMQNPKNLSRIIQLLHVVQITYYIHKLSAVYGGIGNILSLIW